MTKETAENAESPADERQATISNLPIGRMLDDFKPLLSAEKKLLRAVLRGEVAKAGDQRPDTPSRAVSVRAAFIRFLVLGGGAGAPVHERGVRLAGAWLKGELDLQATSGDRGLFLSNCHIETVSAEEARLKFLVLTGSKLANGLRGDGLKCEGDVSLNGGFEAAGEVGLTGARIGGILDCGDGRFEVKHGPALAIDRAEISGSAFLNGSFHAEGEVRFVGAIIGGSLVCDKGRFENRGDNGALVCDRARIEGSIFLRNGFHAIGQVRFHGAVIKGDLDCTGGKFEAGGSTALSCDRTRVAGRWLFRRMKGVDGLVDLSLMQLGTLCDAHDTWESLNGRIILDGFGYDRIAGGAPTDADFRIQWLCKQLPDHLNEDFRPQPWEQLIGVLRAMGHSEEARQVAIAKHKKLRNAKRYVGGSKTWDSIYGTLVGYGYRPWKLMSYIVGVWIGAALIYWPAVNPQWFGSPHHLIAPAKSQAEIACEIARSRDTAKTCARPRRGYSDFFVPAYSAEVLLPIVTLGYKGEWKPVVSTPQGEILWWGWAVRVVYWSEIIFGWLASLLLVAAVGNLVKKD